MPILHFTRPGLVSSRRRPLDPRWVLGAVLALSLIGLGALPRGAGAFGGTVSPPFSDMLAGGGGCRVTEIVDGDTVTLSCPGRPDERARLTGFDTPEFFGPKCWGERTSALQAKRRLGALIREADHLGIVRQGHDRYGRALVAMSVDGRPVAREMVNAGLARPYDGGRRGRWCGAEPQGPIQRGTTARWVAAGDDTPRGGRGTAARWVRVGG